MFGVKKQISNNCPGPGMMSIEYKGELGTYRGDVNVLSTLERTHLT